jgi:hypothetical protein
MVQTCYSCWPWTSQTCSTLSTDVNSHTKLYAKPNFWYFFWPLLCAMQDTQDAHYISFDTVCRKVRSAGYYQLARSVDSSLAAYLREMQQFFDRLLDPEIDFSSGRRVVHFYKIENRLTVCNRESRPFDLHELLFCFQLSSGPTLRKVCFNLLMGNRWPRIVESFLHLGAEPRIMFRCISCGRKR